MRLRYRGHRPLSSHPFHQKTPPKQPLGPRLLGKKVAADGEHLGRDVGREGIHLPGVLVDLAGVEHTLESARLLGKLEQPLPLVLREGSLLSRHTRRVLSLALGLPLGNLELLAGELSLVVLVVVEIGVVRLDAIEEEVAGLLKEGVDGEVERLEARVSGDLDGIAADVVERGGHGDLGALGGSGYLVEERGEEVRVVDLDGELLEDVLVGELGGTEAVYHVRSVMYAMRQAICDLRPKILATTGSFGGVVLTSRW